jgi:putative membrane protein
MGLTAGGRGRGGGEGVRTRDHLANTRTMLAWTRAGLALLALGYAVDKVDLVVELHGGRTASGGGHAFGLAACAAGVAVAGGALARYFWQRTRIEGSRLRTGGRVDLLLAAVAAFGGVLVILALVRNP